MRRSFLPATRLLVLVLLASVITACQRGATTTISTRSAEEATLRSLDAEWSKAAGAKDVDKTASYYADDALILPPNMASIQGKQGARAM